jgi:hypothetical protein
VLSIAYDMFRQPHAPDPLEQLEREANDDLGMLDELGPAHFGTEHLIELRQELLKRLGLFQRRLHLSMGLAVCAIGWSMVVLYAKIAGLPFWAWTAGAFSALSAAACFFVFFLLKKRSKGKNELEQDLWSVEAELRGRSNKRRTANGGR